MLPDRLRHEEPTREVPNYNLHLRTLAAEIGIHEDAISDRGFALASELLEMMRQEHGDPTKDSYKDFHNDGHAMDGIRTFWTLWKPLSEALPERFPVNGFEKGMIALAGHDIKNDPDAAKDSPGQNERESAELVRDMMLASGYEESDGQDVYDAIIKTTVEFKDGALVQTQMRTGSRNILGLCVGQADMNPLLIHGPRDLVRTLSALWWESSDTPVKSALSNPSALFKFIHDEKGYLATRVKALSGDLKHYVDDEEERQAIIQVYRQEFSTNSARALQAADMLQSVPLQAVEEACSFASRTAQRKLSRVAAVAHFLTERVTGPDQKD